MFEQTFKNIDDVLWKEAGCTTELDYTEQTLWMLSTAAKPIDRAAAVTPRVVIGCVIGEKS